MATLPYSPYQPAVTPGRTVAYREESKDPRKLVANTRALTQETGDNLMSQDQQLANQYFQQASGTQSYLNDLENPLAAGQGGYTGTESDNINLSPEARAQIQFSDQDRQNIITGAGISAGAGTASAVGAAERAAAATGGNPAALATYRARAAQTQGAQAGDAMTQARVAAKQAGSQGAQAAQQLGSQGAQAVGNARIGQQTQALSYYNGLQGQQNTSGQNEQGLQQGAYGTQTSGTTADARTGVEAQDVYNKTPTTYDKIMAGIGTAASAAGAAGGGGGGAAAAADGMRGYLDEGTDAVVAEDGPEMIVEASSDPVRSDTKFMGNGGIMDLGMSRDNGVHKSGATVESLPQNDLPPVSEPMSFMDNGTAPGTPSGGIVKQGLGALQNYLTGQKQQPVPGEPGKPGQSHEWNKTTPYQQLGAGIGSLMGRHQAQQRAAAQQRAGGSAGQPSGTPPMGQTPHVYGQVYGPNPSRMPGGMINRTGSPVDGVPSQGMDGSPSPVAGPDLGAAESAGPDLDTAPAAAAGFGDAAGVGDGIGAAVDAAPMAADSIGTIGEGIAALGNGSMGYRATSMASGGFGVPHPPRIITTPTHVHLNKGDAVVPLSYRPEAKVRPSFALDAAMSSGRRPYGASRGA